MSEPAAAKLLEDLEAVVRAAEGLLEATATQTGEHIESVRGRTRESLQQAKDYLSDVDADALQTVRDAAAATDDYIRKNPWQSIGIATGVGLLIGLLLRRRD